MRVNYVHTPNISIGLLQMAALVSFQLCLHGSHAEMVEGCIESQLNLSCDETQMINIVSVVLGDSAGCSKTNCCPKRDSCTKSPNVNHVNEVRNLCNGRWSCVVSVIKEQIKCETTLWLWHDNNDFERITYECIDSEIITIEPLAEFNMTTMTIFPVDNGTKRINFLTDKTTEVKEEGIDAITVEHTESEISSTSSGTYLGIAITIVVILVAIILIALLIFKKRRVWAKLDYEVQMAYVRNTESETIYANEDQMLTDFHLSSPFSNDQINDLQRGGSLSPYDIPNKVTTYSVVCKPSNKSITQASSGPQYCEVECVAGKGNDQEDSAKDFVYSLARDPDGQQSFDSLSSNNAYTSAVSDYENQSHQFSRQMDKPDTLKEGDVYENVSVSGFQSDSYWPNNNNGTSCPRESLNDDDDKILVENVLYS